MSAKDKNGVELKVGDRVYYSDRSDELFLIVDILMNELIQLATSDYPVRYSGQFVKYAPARTYTEAEMKKSFQAVACRINFEIGRFDAFYFAPDFQEFLKHLNNPKP